MNQPHPRSIEEGITLAINRAADAVERIVAEGVPYERAVRLVRDASCLGEKSWSRVLWELSNRAQTAHATPAHNELSLLTYSDY